MNKASESIFNGETVIMPMADVQHIEKEFHSCDLVDGTKKGDLMGYTIITKHTQRDMEADTWSNPIYLGKEEGAKFIQAWCHYRHEIEGGTDAFKLPEGGGSNG